MKILISGGAGFIGEKLAIKCSLMGHKVVVLDNLSEQIHDGEHIKETLCKKYGICFVRGDVRNKKDWATALKGCEVLVHLAAETGTGQSMYQAERYVDVNIKGTAVLLDILTNKEARIDKIIVASSRALYGEGKYQNKNGDVEYPDARIESDLEKGVYECRSVLTNDPLVLMATDEQSKIQPTSIYGHTKQWQEEIILSMSRVLSFDAVSLRYQNVYGPGQSLKNPYTGILSIFSTLMMKNKNINIFEDGKESRDFVYIDDVVQATYNAIIMKPSKEKIFNIGSGVPTTVYQVATELKNNFRSESQIVISGNYRLGDIRHNYASIDRAKRCLGYEPKVSFEDGVKFFCEWVSSQEEINAPDYQKSLEEMKDRGLMK